MDVESDDSLVLVLKSTDVVQRDWKIENRSEIHLGGMSNNTDVSLIRAGHERGCSQILMQATE